MNKQFNDRLLTATAWCRPDMHEPDEQGVSAIVTGYHLDNAMGNDPHSNYGEFTVGIIREGSEPEWFNLASLIAMARWAAQHNFAPYE